MTLPGSPRQPSPDGAPAGRSEIVSARRLVVRSASLPVSPGTDPVLRTVALTRDFGGVHAVADVSIEVRRGTPTGLIGPNAARKSTLLATLAGTLHRGDVR